VGAADEGGSGSGGVAVDGVLVGEPLEADEDGDSDDETGGRDRRQRMAASPLTRVARAVSLRETRAAEGVGEEVADRGRAVADRSDPTPARRHRSPWRAHCSH